MSKQLNPAEALLRAVDRQRATRRTLAKLQSQIHSARVKMGNKTKAKDDAEAVFQDSLRKLEAKIRHLSVLERAQAVATDPDKIEAHSRHHNGLSKNIQKATAAHKKAVTTRNRTRHRFNTAVRELQKLVTAREQLEAELQKHQQDIAAAQTVFVHSMSYRGIADVAGVPAQYLSLCITWQMDVINIYFGGTDSPGGPNHGHYVMRVDGTVIYQRNPGEPHGVHNYVKRPRKRRANQ